MYKIPEFLSMFGHTFSVIETTDLNIFLSATNYGRNDLNDLVVWIRKDIAHSLKWAILFHEINEVSKQYYGVPFEHDESQRFDLTIFQILVDNEIDFSKIDTFIPIKEKGR